MKKNKKIVDDFYNEYFRPPKYDEYVSLGGTFKKTYYMGFLAGLGYTSSRKGKTYEVLENNTVIFTGTSKEIAEEFDISPGTVSQYARSGKETGYGYSFRVKEFKGHL